MKKLIFLIILFTTVFTIERVHAKETPKPLEVGIRFGYFYSSLSPHGEWIEIEPGLRVWHPLRVSRHWRPYLVGRWVWTDYGWYWMSHEPFGWITYHYGRWYDDEYYGWIWIPDDTWGPAWVEWRYDDDYIGWAPLPPYAVFHIGVGIHFTSHWIAPVHYWNFVRYRHFGSVLRYRDTTPLEHSRRLIHTTRSGPQHEVNQERIINRGIDRTFIERRGNIRMRNAEVQDVRERTGERLIRSEGNRQMERIEIFRPNRNEIDHSGESVQVRRGERSLSIDMKTIERQRETRDQEQLREPGLKREDQSRGATPRIKEQPDRDRQEMRRELIQRHEQKPDPTPPVKSEQRQRTIEQRRESTSPSIPNNSTRENRSGRGTEKRKTR